jgi:plastocyanin
MSAPETGRRRGAALLALGVGLLLAGCGDDSRQASSLTVCRSAFANCSIFDSSSPAISFGGALGNAYAPRCLQLQAGQRVTFSGDFSLHPLRQACGPAAVIDDFGGPFTFAAAGTYGYYCSTHGNSDGTGMAGAILVVP